MQRLENETNAELKLRRKSHKVALKIKKLGHLYHESMRKGTLIKTD